MLPLGSVPKRRKCIVQAMGRGNERLIIVTNISTGKLLCNMCKLLRSRLKVHFCVGKSMCPSGGRIRAEVPLVRSRQAPAITVHKFLP